MKKKRGEENKKRKKKKKRKAMECYGFVWNTMGWYGNYGFVWIWETFVWILVCSISRV